jgi:predicted O-methyltransferase YrrM
MLGIPFRYLLRHPLAALELVADPAQTWTMVVDNYRAVQESKQPIAHYDWDLGWEEKLHRALGCEWPCFCTAECATLYGHVLSELKESGVRPGPESFASWNDGDAALIRAVWSIVRHTKPEKVVETGVAHGVTSRMILEAMQKNERGNLWSIDLPPLEEDLRERVGIAVHGPVTRRWSYLRGSSRLRLPALLSKVGRIDMFIHDSLHSERNVRFELDLAWSALKLGGVIVVDDVDANSGFRSFSAEYSNQSAMVCQAEPVRPDLRRFNDRGLFGIVLKQASPARNVA